MRNVTLICQKCKSEITWEYNDEPYGGDWYNKEKRPKCCGQMMHGKHHKLAAPYVYEPGLYMKKGKDRLDEGIPFGEVPGDEQFQHLVDDGNMKRTDYIEKNKGNLLRDLP